MYEVDYADALLGRAWLKVPQRCTAVCCIQREAGNVANVRWTRGGGRLSSCLGVSGRKKSEVHRSREISESMEASSNL